MSLRLRILLLQLIGAAAVGAMGVALLVLMERTREHRWRVEAAQSELLALTDVAVRTRAYAQRVAELLLAGRKGEAELSAPRGETEAALDRLHAITVAETARSAASAYVARERLELARVDELRRGFAEMDSRARALFAPRGEGPRGGGSDGAARAPPADGLLRDDFLAALARAIDGERDELAQVREEEDALTSRLTLALLAGAALLVPLAALAGHLLARSVNRPVAAWAAAAAAVGRGELGHRVAWRARDELGVLARRFDAMASELADQRGRALDAHAALERRVADRTAELANANRRLRELDRLRVRFMAEIGHELRTPVTVLRGEAEVTLRHGPGTPDPAYRETLSRIAAGAADLGRLVDDLLFLARAEADEVRLHRRRVRLAPILAEAAREGEVLGRRRGIAVEAALPATDREVAADPGRLKQALLIVVDNAVKYAPAGRPIRVECRWEDGREDGMAEVEVHDEGGGIPAEDLPHVFNRFFRGRGAERSAADGSGLGLPIARSIVEKHDGAISIESGAEGRGTAVRIRLPLLRPARAPAPARPDEGSA